MRRFRSVASRKQLSLLPTSVEDYVGAEDIVRYVDELVDLLDLSSIERKYSYLGRPGYEPSIMVKILVFGSLRGIRSARELARECRENLRFIFLAQNEKPDFRTINLFRREHAKELASLLRQTIEIGIREEVIDLKAVAVDGTKLRAFAGHRSFNTAANLKNELDQLESEFAEQFTKDSEVEDDNDEDNDVLPPTFRDKESRQKRLKAAIEEYNSVKGDKPRQVSTTDPDSRFMKGPDGKRPSYNVQAAVDSKSRMAVGGYATKATCDHGELSAVIEEVKDQTKRIPEVVVADRGYAAAQGLVSLEQNKIIGYITQQKDRQKDFIFNESDNTYTCRAGRLLHYAYTDKNNTRYLSQNCDGCNLRKGCLRGKSKIRSLAISHHKTLMTRMRERCNTELGTYYRTLRASVVEPVFGHLKYARKLQRFLHRGLEFVNSIWQFELAVYNIEKLASYRRQTA